MLPKSRILSALLVGLGVALMVAGFAAPRFLLGDGRLPLDLENTTYTLHDENASVEGEAQPVTRQLHMEIQNPATDEMASLRVGDSLFRGAEGDKLEDLITAQTWSWQVDRKSGDALTPATVSSVMIMPTEEIDMEGPWLKLPVNAEAETIELFDPILRDTAEVQLVGNEQIDGRQVDSYTQQVEPTNLAREYAAMNNTKTLHDEEGNASTSYLHYAVERTLQVDHVSGLVIGIDEDVDLYYADASGERAEDYVTYSAATQDNAAKLGQLTGIVSQETSRTITIIVITVGAIIALVGLIGALRPESRRFKSRARAK
ncbi:DUF3068 domain-containing protein [Corynebacterium lubricantis]|uniref:DUF3068 domain-containing protein n=1 Tax=Corynebacterium lubricantis TaxID=541095 RepID=UPI00036A8586|nr:DUF3068 domain-containing protein [Corynebacterium lubricantis]